MNCAAVDATMMYLRLGEVRGSHVTPPRYIPTTSLSRRARTIYFASFTIVAASKSAQ